MTTQYRHVLIDASKPPPTEAALAALAAAAGSALPSDFVEFLKSANGARHDFSVTVEHTDGSSEEVLFGHHFSTGPPPALGGILVLHLFKRPPVFLAR